MSEIELRELRRRLDRLEAAEPTVLAERVKNLSEDVHEIADEVQSLRRVLVGFLVTFAFFGITLVVSLVAFFGGSP